MKTYLLGVLTGAALAFSTGFFRAASAAAWAACAKRWGKVGVAVRTRKQARQSKRATANAAALAAADRVRLTDERVGAKFRKRYTADDGGIILTVVGLEETDWRETVRVKEVAPATRTPIAFDGTLRPRYTIKWKSLNKSEEDQRRMTANYQPRPPEGSDGWVEYERID